jgi:hypothetical protein
MFSNLKRVVLGLPLFALVAVGVAVLSLSPATPVHASEPAPFYCAKVYDPASMASAAGTSTTITCPGVALGDFVDAISSSIDEGGATVTGYVSSANTITLRLFNGTGATLDLASSTWRVRVLPHFQ